MYPINNTALELFKSSQRQTVLIDVETQHSAFTITEADITQGTFVINRYSSSTKKLEIGSAIASEMVMVLDNTDGRFSNYDFEGAEMYVRVKVRDWNDPNSTIYTVPMGYFVVDAAPRKLKNMQINALDRMMLFDKEVNLDNLYFPITAGALLERICSICNVKLATSVNSLPNHTYSINEPPVGENLTYRQYLIWLGELFGKCSFINWRGELEMVWYDYHNSTASTATLIQASDRFSSDVDENDVTITGVQLKVGNTVYLSGTSEYALTIEGNALITHDYQSVLDTIRANTALTYKPYSCAVKPLPNVYPLDKIRYVDSSNVEHVSVVTDWTFALNRTTNIAARGETAQLNGYATANPLTARELAIIDEMKTEVNETLNGRVQTVLAFNELISNALGLFVTEKELEDGSTVYYMHNLPKIEESMIIFTMTAEGIAWTSTGWNGGSPVWSYGVTTAGDALFKMLSAEGIEVSATGEDYRIEVTPRAFSIYYKEMLVTKIEADEMRIPKIIVDDYMQVGKTRLVPYYKNGQLAGTNLVYVD